MLSLEYMCSELKFSSVIGSASRGSINVHIDDIEALEKVQKRRLNDSGI